MSKKGVMLSQHGGSGIGGSKATLGSGGPSIGNYKGVMLCNRPFAGVRVAAATASNASKLSSSFKTGVPDGRDALGLNPTKRLLPHAKPVKRETAMDKHKKWLKEVSKEAKSTRREYDRRFLREGEETTAISKKGRNKAQNSRGST